MTNYATEITYTTDQPLSELSTKSCNKQVGDAENAENIGYTCSINEAKKKKIYDEKKKNFDFSIITREDVGKIDLNTVPEIEKSGKDYKYKLCDSNGLPNCALSQNNIWLTKDVDSEDGNKCGISKNIEKGPWPSALSDGGVTRLLKPSIHEVFIGLLSNGNTDNDICDERWYDWFTIPDYHNGNNFSSQLSSTAMKKVCYKHCKFGSIPINEKNNDTYITKCINRDFIDNGRLKNTFPYTPFSMIILLGSTKKDLMELYKSEFNLVQYYIDKHNNNVENDYQYEINDEILNQIKENNTTDLLLENIKDPIKKAIENIITEPISHLNIVPPIDNKNQMNYSPNKVYNNKDVIIKAYDISKKLSNYLKYDNLKEKFFDWKKELTVINDLDINSWEFNKLLLLLQACCKCCFGFQDKQDILYEYFQLYNNYIITNITKYNTKNITYNRLEFPNYNKEQVLKSIDTNNPFNNFNRHQLDTIALQKIKDYQISNPRGEPLGAGTQSMKKFNNNFKNHHGTIIKTKQECNVNKNLNMININILNNTFSSNIIVYINFFLLSLLMIIYLFLCYNLIILTWKQFSNVFNYILMGIIWIFATFFGIFTTLFGKADNKKGFIINIHKNALKAEWYYGYFTQTLAILNAKKNYLFNGVLFMGIVFIFLTIIKAFIDIANIIKK